MYTMTLDASRAQIDYRQDSLRRSFDRSRRSTRRANPSRPQTVTPRVARWWNRPVVVARPHHG